MRCLFLIALGLFTLQAQSFRHVKLTGGFKIGAPLDEPANNYPVSTQYMQGRWTGGPTVEVHLPRNFSVEFDSLFRNYRTASSSVFRIDPAANPYFFSGQQKTNVWDLPLLLKYRIPLKAFKPFVTAGYQWSHQSVEGRGLYECLGPRGSCLPKDAPFPDLVGEGSFQTSNVKRSLVVGVGVEFKTRYVTIAPEVRFNRPVREYPRDIRTTALVGFTFGRK